jgi:hypothetical protein
MMMIVVGEKALKVRRKYKKGNKDKQWMLFES